MNTDAMNGGSTVALLLTAKQPISHHDPFVKAQGNTQIFNRQKHFVLSDAHQHRLTQANIDALCNLLPVPTSMAELFATIRPQEFVAAAIVKTFVAEYNSREGVGIFVGTERYSRLESRVSSVANTVKTLLAFWDTLTESMCVPPSDTETDATLIGILTHAKGFEDAVLNVLKTQARSVVMIARYWASEEKLSNQRYADVAGKQTVMMQTLSYTLSAIGDIDERNVLELPAIQGNTIRNNVVRTPAWLHLCAALGIEEAALPGGGELPTSVEAFFVNGGNIASGVKPIANGFRLAAQVRAAYPTADLLGGCFDAEDVGESRLRCAAWIVCRENLYALPASLHEAASRVSALDLIDTMTTVRSATKRGVGQMIMSVETLAAGTQVYVQLQLLPFTPTLTLGALIAAVETFKERRPYIGGLARIGCGLVDTEYLNYTDSMQAALAQYNEYLALKRDELLEGMKTGKMTTGATVLS